ncbi:sulfatase [Blastopirellula sp. JC732]|uniref:Sulfatase n=1 Tax=Blastopirellula sediminis TaxID=2894196 RepID=A0A9X1MJJ0_9BACT|nr:sulfatase [Blastopirellula sediminis]MCC9609533.1 sulfatase [Blastopirellula sediminis]MCC9627691.1 sulfatase [Blastopirellula sediminis]
MIRLAFCALLALPFFTSLALAEKPNILFIAIDDQNDWIGCLGGHPQAKTPYIDALAARGTVFLNAHCQAPLCNSSRTSLLTGLRPSTTGIHGLAPWFRDVDSLSDLVTLPQYLRKNGYTSYSTGKIFHGNYGRHPKKDDEFDHLGPASAVGAKPKEKLVQTPAPHPLVDWGTFPHRDEDKGDYHVASWAVETLDNKPKEPFFLSVGFFLPHVPCYATQKWFDLYPEDEVQLPPFMQEDRDDTPRFSWYLHWKLPEPRQKFLVESGEWRNLVRSYLACTSFVDDQVGRVMKALEANGYADNTVVVLWSDHGWHLGEKGITGKNTLWDRSTRVPLIFAGPGVAIQGKCTQPVELLDIYPTLIDLCGLPAKGDLEGLSLTPQLQDAKAERERPAITTHNQGNHGIRTEKWRYIHYADGSEELYDMQSDPQEINNLADKPELAEVKKELASWLPKVDVHAAPGSAHRILTYDDNIPIWEGEVIHKDDPIPEL